MYRQFISINTPASKIDFKRQLQRLRQGFEQQTMLGKVVTPPKRLNEEIATIKDSPTFLDTMKDNHPRIHRFQIR